MDPNVDILQFLSSDEIDKVVASGQVVVFNGGPSGTSYATSDAIAQWQQNNPYGKKGLIRYRWMLDSTGDWNSPATVLEYAYTVDAGAWGGPVSDPIAGVIMATAVGVNDGQMRFRTLNGHHSNVTYTGTGMSPGPDSFSGVSHNVTFQWALMEIE